MTLSGPMPAHLQKLVANSITSDAMKNVSVGMFSQIVGKNGRFAVRPAGEDEFLYPQLELPVIVIGANPVLSKRYYLGAYDPNAKEIKAPDCYSDNGIGPSAGSSAPQSERCATCPHNSWNSGVNGKGKACNDRKNLAVILPDDIQLGQEMVNYTEEDPVLFRLEIPPASQSPWGKFCKDLAAQGAPIEGVRIFLGFDPQVVGKFTFRGEWATAEQVDLVEGIKETEVDGIKALVGMDDVYYRADSLPALPAPVPAVSAQRLAPAPVVPPVAPTPVYVAAPMPIAPPPVAAAPVEAPKRRGRGRPPTATPAPVAPVPISTPASAPVANPPIFDASALPAGIDLAGLLAKLAAAGIQP